MEIDKKNRDINQRMGMEIDKKIVYELENKCIYR